MPPNRYTFYEQSELDEGSKRWRSILRNSARNRRHILDVARLLQDVPDEAGAQVPGDVT